MQNSKAVLVTGASSGIGKECALRLASRGFRVFAGVRKDEDGERLKAEASGSITPVLLDVTDSASIASAAQEISRSLGAAGLHGLVNNAGIAVAGPLEMLPTEALRRQFDVNVVGQIAVTQAFLPMLRAARGRIIIMGSILGRLALPFVGAYSAAKFALEALAESLGMEIRPFGVSVSIIEPGNIATPIWSKSRSTAMDTAGDLNAGKWDLYRVAAESFQRYTDRASANGISAGRVALVVEKALSSRRPRSRYTVGWDSRFLGHVAPLAPGKFRQWVVLKVVLRK
jgi:NAD(P)-dependent dehydrogenase (short-subunit alcohol dehydrogenase family)